MIKAVLFDLDNTLVDFMRMKKEAIKAAVAEMLDVGLEMGYKETYEEIMKIYSKEGIEYQEVFDRFLFDRYGLIDHKILASAIVGYRRAREATLILYPHVTSTLMGLTRRGIKLAIVTDAPAKQAWLRLCYLKLHHFFDTVVTPDETGAIKPSPIPFKLALQKLNVKAKETMMVGDWIERDLVGAMQVGIHTIYARYGDHHGGDTTSAEFTIDDFSQIIEIVDQISEKSN